MDRAQYNSDQDYVNLGDCITAYRPHSDPEATRYYSVCYSVMIPNDAGVNAGKIEAVSGMYSRLVKISCKTER